MADKIDPTNPEVSQQRLADIVDQVEATLKGLLDSKLITDRHYVLMHTNRLYVRMNYLYFVPNTHQVCLSSQRSNIAVYLINNHL